MKEQWKSVKDYEDYEVSNLGRVKSLERFDSLGHRRKEKLLKPGKNSRDYFFVRLSKNGVKKPFLVHRLVYEAFVEEIPEGMQVNHIDENKENNKVENLNLMTSKENCNWGTRNKKVAAALINHPQRSKAIEAIDKVTGRVVYIFPSTMEAERQGFFHGNVVFCCNGKLNSYKGFIWRYIDQ